MFIPQAAGLTAMLVPLIDVLSLFLLRDEGSGFPATLLLDRLLLLDGLRWLRLLLGTLGLRATVRGLSGELCLEIVLLPLQAALLGPFSGQRHALFGRVHGLRFPLLVDLDAVRLTALVGFSLLGFVLGLLAEAIGARPNEARRFAAARSFSIIGRDRRQRVGA